MNSRVVVSTALLLACTAATAAAQGSYVAASVVGDIVRASRVETATGFDPVDTGGEALGWAIRAGTPFGAAWGIEAEFATASEIRRDSGQVERTAG